ncbi:MAG: hypothetical protein ACP5KL_07195 [Thermoplasmata archaeon]
MELPWNTWRSQDPMMDWSRTADCGLYMEENGCRDAEGITGGVVEERSEVLRTSTKESPCLRIPVFEISLNTRYM